MIDVTYVAILIEWVESTTLIFIKNRNRGWIVETEEIDDAECCKFVFPCVKLRKSLFKLFFCGIWFVLLPSVSFNRKEVDLNIHKKMSGYVKLLVKFNFWYFFILFHFLFFFPSSVGVCELLSNILNKF